MRVIVPLLLLPLALVACSSKSDKANADKVTITSDGKQAGDSGFSIDTGDFKASLDIPGMDMGGKSFDIDGMKLLPGSKVRGMKIVDREKGSDKDGVVTVSFVSPGTPADILAHAESQAKGDGWNVARTADGLGATKGEKTLAYKVVGEGKQTSGTITLTGDD